MSKSVLGLAKKNLDQPKIILDPILEKKGINIIFFLYFFRGRRKPEMLNIGQDRDRSAPTLPPPGLIEKPVKTALPVEAEPKVTENPEKQPKNFKNRIDKWAKDAEQDAEIGAKYLDKKREIKSSVGQNGAKKSSVTDIVPETDVMKAMEVVEDASGLREAANPRKKTPPGGKLLQLIFFKVFYLWFNLKNDCN